MELREYLRMLRRGWWAIGLVAVVFVSLAGAYSAVTPSSYSSVTVLFVSPNSPKSITDLQQGTSFTTNAVVTYAQIIDSVTVLGPVSRSLTPQVGVDQLAGMVRATVRPSTTLIDVSVSGPDRANVAAIANAVGAASVDVIPQLEAAPGQPSLVRVQQIRLAEEPSQADAPNVKRILVLGLLIGLLAGVALTIIVQTVDSRLRLASEVREVSDLPVLAAVPPWPRPGSSRLVSRNHPTGAGAESFRQLRSNLRLWTDDDSGSLLVTSVTDGGDSALVAANLAWSLAQTGRRVVVIDLDVRRSAVGDVFDLRGGPGLVELLSSKAELSDVVREVGPSLDVLPAGRATAASNDLVSSYDMTHLLAEVSRDYDHVILHAAPPSFSYVGQMAETAGATLLCVPMGRAREHELTRALIALDSVGVTPVGLALTRASTSVYDVASGPHERLTPRRPRGGRARGTSEVSGSLYGAGATKAPPS